MSAFGRQPNPQLNRHGELPNVPSLLAAPVSE